MSTPCQSACTAWASDTDFCATCNDYDTTFDPDLIDTMLNVSSDILFELSGRRFAGSCQDTVRPCACSCGSGWRCGCGCRMPSSVTLGAYPITSIVEVLVDGQVVDPGRYRVDDWKYLVRLRDADGKWAAWPCSQDLTRPTTDEDTWQVTFTYGTPPPAAGVRAAAALACELLLACQPDGSDGAAACRLPKRVQQITRQGVSMVLLDPFEFLREGHTGVYEVDLFLNTYNPHRLKRASTVISPDMPRVVRAGT